MAGVPLHVRQVDSRNGVLTLFDNYSAENRSPIIEVTNKAYLLVAYNLLPGQKITVVNVGRYKTWVQESPFVVNGNPMELTSESPTALLAITGSYRLILSSGLRTVFAMAFPQNAAGRVSPVQSDEIYRLELEPDGISEIIQVVDTPKTVTVYGATVGDLVRVLSVYNGLTAPFAQHGQPLVLTGANSVGFLDRTGDYVLQTAASGISAIVRPNYVDYQNPYLLKGEKGDPGTPGGGGTGGTAIEFTQPSPSTQWIINHNLGFKPSVELRTVGGMEFDADVVHVSLNQTVVNTTIPIAGTARLT